MNLTLYARVSTSHQDVDQQMRALRHWCRNNNHRIVHEIWDVQGATIPLTERIKFNEMLNNPKGDGVVVFNLDRLSRHWADQPIIENYFKNSWSKFKLISLHDEINLHNANGRLMFRIKFAINCQSVEDMKEKQGIGIERARKQGKFKGRKKGAVAKKKYNENTQNNNTLHLQYLGNFIYSCIISVKRLIKQVFACLNTMRGYLTLN